MLRAQNVRRKPSSVGSISTDMLTTGIVDPSSVRGMRRVRRLACVGEQGTGTMTPIDAKSIRSGEKQKQIQAGQRVENDNAENSLYKTAV